MDNTGAFAGTFEALRAAHYPLLPVDCVVPLGNHGGFSGARLFRLKGPLGDHVLRVWPAERAADEIASIHVLMMQARQRLAFVPALVPHRDGGTLLAWRGDLVEIASWQPGVADFWANPAPARLQAACRAVAALHDVWQTQSPRTGACPGILRRLESLRTWDDTVRSGWRPSPAAPQVLREAFDLAGRWREAARDALVPWLNIALPLHPCLCDIWHDHVLFTGDEVTGVIDYGSVKNDHAAVDLARLLGSLIEDDETSWRVGLDAYDEVRRADAMRRELPRLLERTGTIVALTHWLRWLGRGERKFADTQAALARLQKLVTRVGRWTRLVP